MLANIAILILGDTRYATLQRYTRLAKNFQGAQKFEAKFHVIKIARKPPVFLYKTNNCANNRNFCIGTIRVPYLLL